MNTHLIIKPLTTADIQKVRLLHSSLLPVNYPTSFFIQLSLLPNHICFVAYHPVNQDNPIAFISASLQANSCIPKLTELHPNGQHKSNTDIATSHIEILTLGVLPTYQQQGIARLLVQQVYDYFREHPVQSHRMTDDTLIHTNVATSNIPALSFYERMGMKIATGVIRNLYHTCPHGSRDGYLLIGRIQS